MIDSTDIIGPTGLGFTKEMFDIPADADFTTFVSGVIAEQSILLEGRIGPLVYNTAADPTLTRVERVEKCLTAAELLDRRINKRLVNVQAGGQEFDVNSERKQRDDYLTEAETIINKNLLVVFTTRDGVESSDFANGVLVTTHFRRFDRFRGRRA